MLNKLTAFVRRYELIVPGDEVVCAISGGADSVALLFTLYLLQQKLQFHLSAAHFNHQLRGAESDRDEDFVRTLCDRYDIPLHVGTAPVKPGKKGLEAAAREARYAFFDTLPGKIATAHTADDNAETVLMHLVRGTGLKGLGGITPQTKKLIRPMLTVTRQDVLDFLQEYCLQYVTDSSNTTDDFLRNRLRHHVMPLLTAENPRLAENLTTMALSLRQDEAYLQQAAARASTLEVEALRQMEPALRSRILENFLKENGVREPEYRHISMVQNLVFSSKPSARAELPGGVTVERCYGTLRVMPQGQLQPVKLQCPGETVLPQLGLKITCCPAQQIINTDTVFTLQISGDVWLRSRQTGDSIHLSGGSKTLKKLFIDRKIPASQRSLVPVLTDGEGVLAVYGIGADQKRIPMELPAMQFVITEI
ncbi:MAG: tRNA lysidine(34) synthetase TilS [Oscillospiraceae bacterium]|nr:tRNA lysidine(34) synthetase TilS [Oscillospiraceae bacterium]